MHGLPGLVLRRALAQRRVLASLLVLVTAATTLLGVGTLLLGPTEDRSFRAGVRQLDPAGLEVDAYLLDLTAADAPSARRDAAALVREVLAPLDPTLSESASARMRRLEGGEPGSLGYVATGSALRDHASLVAGRWPEGAGEVAVPVAAADRLRLAPGDAVTLGAETGLGGADDALALTVVGTYRATGGPAWAGDALAGAGADPAYNDGSGEAPAYGPFLMTHEAFLATGSTLTSLRVTGVPDQSDAGASALAGAAAALADAPARLSADVGDRARTTRLASDLPATLDRVRDQQASTRGTVLTVLLLAAALALAAMVLAGRLLAAVRDEERALLVGLGLSGPQQARVALGEAALVAVVAAVLAAPAAALLHAALTRLPAVRAAGLAQRPALTGGLLLAVLAGAAVLAVALAAPALDRDRQPRPRTRRRRAVSLGGDLLLAGLAAAAAWQLLRRPAEAGGGDLVTTLAPVVALAAATTLLVRRLPSLLGLLARGGARARTLVLPLAVTQAARRPHPALALVLLATAVAAGTFAVALHATWERSQQDQADLRVGTDAALALPGPASAADAAAVARVARGAAVSPVVASSVALGRYVGRPGATPALLALDATRAGDLVRGRLPGRSWSDVGDLLAPDAPVSGVPLAEGATTLTATAPPGAGLSVVATAVVQSADGFRSPVGAAPVPADGRPHRVRWSDPLTGSLVAVRYALSGTGRPGTAPVTLALRVPGTPGGSWDAAPLGRQSSVGSASADVTGAGGVTTLTVTATTDLSYFQYTGAAVLLSALEPADAVPAVVSRQVVDATGVAVGGELTASVEDTSVPLRVVGVVHEVPSAAGRAAVLVDVDTLSRALLSQGRLDPAVDGWWVGSPDPGTVGDLRGLGLGPVTTRAAAAAELSRGPLRVTTPLALVLFAGAAVALFLAGAVLLVGADQQRRAGEVARLRALGLTRREARRLLGVEHVLLLIPLVLVGSLVGAGAALGLAPTLIRSDLGAAPVPRAVAVWPWPAELALVGGLLVAGLLVAALGAARQVRRADPASLRTAEL